MRKIIRFVLKYSISFFLVIYSFTFGLLTWKGRGLLNDICLHFNLVRLTNKILMNLPFISFSDIIDNNNISLFEPIFQSGNVNIGELAVINGIIMRCKPNAIFELGTFDGRTALNMAMCSPKDCIVYTLNLPPDEEITPEFRMHEYDKGLADLRFQSGSRFLKYSSDEFPQIKKIKQLYGDTAKFDFTPYFGKIDLIFIDAAHTYEYVLSDSEISLKLLRNGKGIILWHDYRNDTEVIKAIDTFRTRHDPLDIRHIAESDVAYLEIK